MHVKYSLFCVLSFDHGVRTVPYGEDNVKAMEYSISMGVLVQYPISIIIEQQQHSKNPLKAITPTQADPKKLFA